MSRQDKSSRHDPRLLAEWISFGISLLLILALTGFLVFEALQRHDKALPIEIEVETRQITQAGGQYVLPVRVRNTGHRTMRKLIVRVGFEGPGAPSPMEIDMEYLGENSEQTIHCYTDADPRQWRVWARPLVYLLD